MRWFHFTLVTLFVMALTGPVHALEWGEGFDPVDPPATTESDGKVEVVEFFWYGCPHCYHLEPYMEEWLKHKPENVAFRRVPAPLNPSWSVHAHFYYAAQILGLEEKLHKPLFDALHKEKRRLYDKESLLDFVAEQGFDKEEFRRAWESFAVALHVKRAKQLAEQYQIDAVPVIGINGKYKTSVSLAGSPEKMFEIINKLIKEESSARQVAPDKS